MTSASCQINNLDFIRLVSAVAVLYSHQFALLAYAEPSPFLGITYGSLGVVIFFTISGYLVTNSWLRDSSVFRFIVRRLLRLMPALILLAVLSIFVLGAWATNFSAVDYFSSPKTWRYLNIIRLAIVYELPGVFHQNP